MTSKRRPRRTKRYLLVREVCIQRSITLRQAGEEMGLTPPALQYILRCKNPQPATIGRIRNWLVGQEGLDDQLKEKINDYLNLMVT